MDTTTSTTAQQIRLSAEEAEAICATNGYVPTYELLPGVIEDWGGALHGYPLFYYPVRCDLHTEGIHVGQGNGSCNSWEKKYRYRGGDRVCPQCSKSGTLIKGKLEFERDAEYKRRGAWICYEKRGGCGAKYFGDDVAVTGQETGRVDNPDFADIVHTVRSMADKRALVAAVLKTKGAAGRVPVAPPQPQPVQQQPRQAAPPPPAEPVDDWKAQQPTLGQLRAQADAMAAQHGQHAGTQAAADAVAAAKLAKLRKGPSVFPKFETPAVRVSDRLPANMTKLKDAFAAVQCRVSPEQYAAAFARVGGPDCHRIDQLDKLTDLQAVYDLLLDAAASKKGVAA